MAEEKRVVTVEATGKKYKLAQALGIVGILVGVFAAVAGASTAATVLLVAGGGAYLYGRFAGWWHHG